MRLHKKSVSTICGGTLIQNSIPLILARLHMFVYEMYVYDISVYEIFVSERKRRRRRKGMSVSEAAALV